MNPDWSKEELFDTEIAPLIRKLVDVCCANNLPLVLSVQFGAQGEKAQVASSIHINRPASPLIELQAQFIQSALERATGKVQDYLATPEPQKPTPNPKKAN